MKLYYAPGACSLASRISLVMLRRTRAFGVPLIPQGRLFERVLERSTVRRALAEEALSEELLGVPPAAPVVLA